MKPWRVAASFLVMGCHHAPAPTVEPEPPADEVWLSPQQVRDAKIEIQPVATHDVDDTILTSGSVALDDLRTGHVFSPVTGRVISIVAGLGQRVNKGDPLAIIESPDIGNAVSDAHKAQAELIAAEHDLKRKKELFEKRAVAAGDLEAATDNYNRAKAEMERAVRKEQLLRVGNADTVTQRFSLPSPVDGEVLNRNISPGLDVVGQYSGGASVELFTVGELEKVWVLGDLYEMDFARVKVGAPVIVTVVAYPKKEFSGVVDWVSGQLDSSTRTAKVRCTFENKDRFLRPNMYATVQISVDKENALAIPRNALLRLGNDKAVFVETGESGGLVRFKKVTIEKDAVDEGEASQWLVIRKGLEPGQQVVVNGAILLSQKL
jgi:cobalt-zinc-cadmium efflux system membrane fusion protein